MNSAVRAILFVGISVLAAVGAERAGAQRFECTKLAECGQELVGIANKLTEENKVLVRRIETLEASTAVAELKKQLTSLQTRVVSGNKVLCTAPNNSAADSIAQCGEDEEFLGGGCNTPCYAIDHLTSLAEPQNSPNKWTCRNGAQPGSAFNDDKLHERTYNAIALCRKKLKM